MHLSTIEAPWGKSFTNKRYLHPHFEIPNECPPHT